MTQLLFDGKVAVVTGAASGLGLSHARALAERGARVLLNDIARRNEESAAETEAALLRSEGYEAHACHASVGDEAQAEAIIQHAVDRWGRIDLLVNNAGNSIAGRIQDVRTEDLRTVLEVHLMGMFWTMRAALQHMREQNYGRIVNTASALGAFGAPDALPYVTAKAAIIGLSRAASLDNRDRDIRINTICPVAYTPMAKPYFDTHPELDTRRLDVSAVSPAVVYLAHESCELNGEVLSVAAGRVARIFTATVPGFVASSLTAEDLARNFGVVMDTVEYSIPDSSIDQYQLQPKS
ncbi:SDR family NAD(P)-dependent oxidoreductase [Henriciella aquimarina]|uniref:SDR family NAD(P)-dependent oxidoreductase n=1 Tax=Henriciella aquimarina TaxID=545261 RepID=UPI0009FD37A6|nr:SDR family NAD(P)-dependent oxidoreductase [Henriciella aquimarina]